MAPPLIPIPFPIISSSNSTSSDCYSVPDFSQASSVHPHLPPSGSYALLTSSYGLETRSDKVGDQNQEQRALLIAAAVVLQHGRGDTNTSDGSLSPVRIKRNSPKLRKSSGEKANILKAS